ncbi:FG-GAP repeat domain-containing protein [Microbacterium insulae]|uniref:FG-GAP repeat domain-containing protein n=1 Tax=Microbacterium insulae TaxID=483014 RepID=A0ABW3AFB8_9MICO
MPHPRAARSRLRRFLAALVPLTLIASSSGLAALPAVAAETVSISGTLALPEGASVNIRWVDAVPEGSLEGVSARVTRDATFTIPGLEAGRPYVIRVWHDYAGQQSADGFLTGDPADPETGLRERAKVFTPTSDGLANIVLPVENRGAISGVVRRADGTPVSNQSVIVVTLTDYGIAPPFFSDWSRPRVEGQTDGDGRLVVRGLESVGDEVLGHAVAIRSDDTARYGFVGEDSSTGLVPWDRARIFPRGTGTVVIPDVVIPVPRLPADQFILAPRLTPGSGDSYGPSGEILQVSGGTLSAFQVKGGVLEAGIALRSGLEGERIYGPGNWGRFELFWSADNPQYVPRNDLLTVRPDGTMWMYEGDGQGFLRPPVQIGRGWQNYRVIPAGDLTGDRHADLLAIDSGGYLKLYRGDGKGGFLSPYPRVGRGWKGYDLYAAGDLTRDGKEDILSVDSVGTLWLYAGRGDGSFEKRRQVGRGWSDFTLAAGADIDGVDDYRTTDIVGRDDRTGNLYLYSGLGSGGFAPRKLIATGW